jgi:uncharacterized membrane protein (DUF106 family)
MLGIVTQVDAFLAIKEYFWHMLAIAAIGLLGKMLNKYMNGQEETLKDVKEILTKLQTKTEVHEVKIDGHDKRLEKLENG